MTLLVVGSTGTLGRQIVRKALNEGFQVKCLVRNFRKSAFLKEWGAEMIYGDLSLLESIPLALAGVTSIIDCSTSRPNDLNNIHLIDLKSKYILIESAIKADIKRYVFFSILNTVNYKDIPLLNLKLMIEHRLKISGLSYTIFYLPGFFQGLIPQYALPILDKQSVWITRESSLISYINTQDVANITVRSLSVSQFSDSSLPLSGLKSWKSLDIINLCERISGRRAQINTIPIYLLNTLKNFVKLFQWTWNISERLSFIEMLSRKHTANAQMKEVLYILKIDKKEIEKLEAYFQEYFERVMKKVKELNYQVLSNDNNVNQIKF
uniref:NmrA-like domain-containing protein n=1 Tax=Pleurostichidium falkenbergii TaxID=121064 RepID=A0A4D6UUU1_9FLOR|nr:hypothetical protein [Pleurostichidium falkenbergii]QCH39642.1 hypothetical protein [Pleurostichidium falkenbergii]